VTAIILDGSSCSVQTAGRKFGGKKPKKVRGGQPEGPAIRAQKNGVINKSKRCRDPVPKGGSGVDCRIGWMYPLERPGQIARGKKLCTKRQEDAGRTRESLTLGDLKGGLGGRQIEHGVWVGVGHNHKQPKWENVNLFGGGQEIVTKGGSRHGIQGVNTEPKHWPAPVVTRRRRRILQKAHPSKTRGTRHLLWEGA